MYKQLLSLLVCSLFATLSVAQIDTTVGLTAPGSVTGDYKTLTHYLCDPLSGDKAKANAIYNWITHNISYDVYALKTFPKKRTPQAEIAQKTLDNRLGVCEGYSVLFTQMCREAGLKAVNVDGYAKDWMFDNGDKVFIPRHQWCAVLINGTWELADPTWGAGGLVQWPNWFRRQLNKVLKTQVMYAKKLKFRFKYDPQYFMQDVMVFRQKHLPTDPIWQLTDTLMPRSYYEAGDSAVKSFNAMSKRIQNNDELMRISDLEETQKIFEYAERAYKYNDRYPCVLAQKQIFRAVSEVEKAFTDSTIETGMLLVTDAQRGLKQSEHYIKEQKKAFPDQYNELKKKNKTKSQAAMQDIRKIKTDDKRIIAQCKKYTTSANAKYNKAKKKQGDISKRKQGVGPNKINEVIAAKTQKKSTSPELKVMLDSIEARRTRILDLENQVTAQTAALKLSMLENALRLDSLGKMLGLADSVIVQQTISRLGMKDNYDDEVITTTNLLNDIKYRRSDTLLKYYLVGFDTITTYQDQRQKLRIALLDNYKKNLRTLEQYKKWNSSDSIVTGQYGAFVMHYAENINDYNEDLLSMRGYIKSNRKLFAGLTKLSKRQIKITGYMDKAEKMRKVLEEKEIASNLSFDTKENQKQEGAVRALQQKLQKVTESRN